MGTDHWDSSKIVSSLHGQQGLCVAQCIKQRRYETSNHLQIKISYLLKRFMNLCIVNFLRWWCSQTSLGEQNQCIKYKVCDFESQIVVAKNGPSFYYLSSQEEKECSSMLFVILWDSNGIQKDFYIFFSFLKICCLQRFRIVFCQFPCLRFLSFSKLLFGCFGEFWN